MHPPRAKSAPIGRIRSKKTSAIKEIDEWVLSGKEHEPETSRIHSGQLAENITEERLLRARMMELGKERFKILAKCEHDIQTFKDKQKRKGFRVKFNRPQSATFSATERGLHSERSNLRSASPMMLITPVIRPKTVQFEADLSRGEYLTTGTGLDDGRPRTVPTNTAWASPTVTVEEWTPLIVSNDWARFAMEGSMQISRPASSLSVPSTIFGRNRRAMQTRIAHEPRFAALEKSLSSTYVSDCKTDVPTIIKNTEALRKPVKISSKEARRELELKIKLFMEENNIVF